MYLDNAATTKLHSDVLKNMNQVSFENYNALYYNEKNNVVINKFIDNMCEIIKQTPESVVFTSSASESNNYIIKGIYENYPSEHFICSTIEHKSVIESFKYLENKKKLDVSYVKPRSDGMIHLDDLKMLIKPNTKFVSVMHVNNETGVINDIFEISKYLKSLNILFHTDATQGFCKLCFNYSQIDYVTMSAHKINGPKGIGLALINNEAPENLIHGSSQQNGHRSSTLANELVVGMCSCVIVAYEHRKAIKKCLYENKKLMIDYLQKNLGDKFIQSFENNTVDSILSFQIKNQLNQVFLKNNASLFKGSTGSSCSINEASYVLKECKMSEFEIINTIRFSFSMYESLNLKDD